MGKPRRDTVANQHDAQQHDALLELVLASMCVAVESQASPELSPSPSSSGDALLQMIQQYSASMWKLPLERALAAVNEWSLAKFAAAKPAFRSDIDYPADAKPVEPEQLQQEQQDEESELEPSEQQQKQQKATKKPHKKRLRAAASRSDTPELFRVGRIDEDPLEARWDHQGNPVPLRRNILGEHFAPRSDPLKFIRQNSTRSPSEIYQQMKRAVREDLVSREKHRIQALNDRAKLRKQQLEAQGVLSPEAKLEAKLDRLFVENDSSEAVQQPESSETRESVKKSESVASRGGDEDENHEETGHDDTDAASDSDDNQRRVRVK